MFDKIGSFFKSKQTDSQGCKILVVEDNEVDMKVIVNILEKKKFRVITARDGEQGLKAVQEEHPEIIILDCEMPVLSGIEMCRRIKENPDTEHIPVLFLTGIKTPANVIECFEADAENYLEKPVDPQILILEIEALIAKKPEA